MCFYITVSAEDITNARSLEISRALKDDDDLLKVSATGGSKWLKKLKPGFLISKDSGCSCILLGEEADWNAETWAMKPETLPRLAKTIERLDKEIDGPFTLQAL